MKCDKCGEDAVIYVRYSGAHLCPTHLDEFIVQRVKREIRQSPVVPRQGGILALAVSGGKDSLVMTHLLHRIIGNWRGLRIVAITVDEGIDGYRPESLRIAAKFLAELGIEHRIVTFRDETGFTLDEMRRNKGLESYSPCTYCGVFRRLLINRTAREMGAKAVAFGHNLDDNAQSVLMNVLRGDTDRLLKLAPHNRTKEGMVPRILPLRWIPQKEVYLYALQHEIPIQTAECPYSNTAHRRKPQRVLYELEEQTPGTRHSLLRLQDSIQALAQETQKGEENKESQRCSICGEPASRKICKACEIKMALKNDTSSL